MHGARGEDPTEPPASAPYPYPGGVARAAHPAALRRSRGRRATTRSTRRAGSCSTRRTCRYSACVRCATCDGFPCLVHAKSDAEVLGVRPALEHPNVTLLTNAKVDEARDRTRRARRSPRWSSSATARRERYAADVVVVSCGAANTRQAAARVGERQAPERARQRLRPGRPQLHVPRQPGRARALARGEPDRLPEDARAQRLLLRRRRLRVPARATSRWSASRRRRCSAARSRGETRLAPEWTLERDRAARDRLLALDRGPAAARQPRHASTATASSRSATRETNAEAEAAALRQAQVDARASSTCTRTT